MGNGNIFGLPTEFLNTLSGDDFEKISAAKNTLDAVQEKLNAWRGNGGGENGIRGYIDSVAAKQKKEAADAAALRASFK